MSLTLHALQHIATSPGQLLGRLIALPQPAPPDIRWQCEAQTGAILFEAGAGGLWFGRLDINGLTPGSQHTVRLTSPADASWQSALAWDTLPSSLPDSPEQPFNLLLASCYYQEKDHTETGLGRMLPDWLKRQGSLPHALPHAAFCMGDQIYADVPILQADNETRLLEKYRRNFFGSPGIHGLDTLLSHVATAYLPDDHEYWNNFPDPAFWRVNSYGGERQRAAAHRARACFQGFQTTQAVAALTDATCFSRRFDLGELAVLLLDTRSGRSDDGFAHMLGTEDREALAQWHAHCRQHPEKFPVIVTGQLLTHPAKGKIQGYFSDYELADFEDFSQEIVRCVNDLGNLGSVLMLTGDVHWSRYRRFKSTQHAHFLHEIVVSPASLVASPGDSLNQIKKLNPFGDRSGWPDGGKLEWARHGNPDLDVAALHPLLPGKSWSIAEQGGQRGDQVAMLSLHRTPNAITGVLRYIEASRPYRVTPPRNITLTRA